MNVLMLSLDSGLSKPGSDTEKRLIDYAKYVDHIEIISYGDNEKRRKVNSKINVISFSGSGVIKLLKTMIFAIQYVRNNIINLITTNDPLLGVVGFLIKHFAKKTKLNINVLGLELASDKWLNEKPALHLLIRSLSLFVLKRADSIRSDSRYAIEMLTKFGIDRKKMFFIPLIPSQTVIENLKKNKWENPKKNVLLCVGSLIPQKGYEIILQAFEQVVQKIPTAKLVCIGDGSAKGALIRLANKLNIKEKVDFIGQVAYGALPEYYLSSDLLVVSSWFEGGPRVVMEAALCGLPIVSTNVGSVADMLTNDRSVKIVTPGDVDGLAKAIINLLRNDVKRKLFSTRAKKQMLRYCDYKKNKKNLLKLWKRTISR